MTYTREKGLNLSWSEAWVSTFALVAQDYCLKYKNLPKLPTFGSIGLAYGDVNYETYNIEIADWVYEHGDTSEYSIAQLLWDLLDDSFGTVSSPETENIHLSYKEWFDLTTVSNTYTVLDLCNRIVSNSKYSSIVSDFRQLCNNEQIYI